MGEKEPKLLRMTSNATMETSSSKLLGKKKWVQDQASIPYTPSSAGTVWATSISKGDSKNSFFLERFFSRDTQDSIFHRFHQRRRMETKTQNSSTRECSFCTCSCRQSLRHYICLKHLNSKSFFVLKENAKRAFETSNGRIPTRS